MQELPGTVVQVGECSDPIEAGRSGVSSGPDPGLVSSGGHQDVRMRSRPTFLEKGKRPLQTSPSACSNRFTVLQEGFLNDDGDPVPSDDDLAGPSVRYSSPPSTTLGVSSLTGVSTPTDRAHV